MEEEFIFPIHRLGLNVTDVLSRMDSSGLFDIDEEKFDNQINFMDLGGPITTVSKIIKDPLTQKCHVSLSAAFFQFLWMMSNIAIRTLDAIILEEEIKAMSHEDKIKFDRELKTNIDSMKEIIDIDTVFRQTFEELKLAMSLREKRYNNETVGAFASLPYHTHYGSKTNSVCIFGIAFILLHEHAHYEHGHMDTLAGDISQEKDADCAAFWTLYTDVKSEEKFTANVGILSALFSLMMLNPTFENNDEHPQEYKRFLDVYEEIKSKNYKYAIIVIHLFKIWAYNLGLQNFPDIPYNDEGVQQIKRYIEDTYLPSL